MPWLLLVTSLSGHHGTLRLHFWRQWGTGTAKDSA
jgi:hypothetical protein